MWHTKLQIAIIEKNPELMTKLVNEMPDFTDLKEMKSAASLIKEALKVLHTLQDETGREMQKLKKHKDFLASSNSNNTQKNIQRLDITS